MKTWGIAGTKGARRAGAVWGVLFLAAAACGPAFSATLEWGTYLGGSGVTGAVDGTVVVAGETQTADLGALCVTLTPPEAVAAGAQWRRVGTEAWFDSGSVEGGIPAGTTQVEFRAGDYWTVPPVQTVTVTAGLTAVASAECAPAGALRITLVPEEAALAGAQWRRSSGGAWFDSGVVEAHIPPGEWNVSFKGLSYWIAPPDQMVTVTAGTTAEALVEYAPGGAIRVTMTPPEAMVAGGAWRLVGAVLWQSNGNTVWGIPPGDHQVEFRAVAGWIAPPTQPVTVTAGVTSQLAASYTDNRGVLRVTIAPAEAVAAGARWRIVLTTTWIASGTTMEVPAGNYPVEFKAVSGWTAPSTQTVAVAGGGETAELAAVYTMGDPGALRVTITPPEAVAAGAQWRRVGTTTWRVPGTTEADVPVGNHQVEFKAVAGWFAPSAQLATVTAGSTTELAGVYASEPPGAIRVTITPAAAVTAGAQWRRVGTTTWRDSGATEADVPVGDYQVEFKAVPGWKPTSLPTVSVPAGGTAETSGVYAPFTEISATPRAGTWVTNGDVRAVATTPGVTYIGGDFTYVGPNTGCYAALDAATETPLSPYAKVNGTVLACVPDGGGGWYIGGDFTKVGTVARYNIAHILHTGALDPAWNPHANSQVRVLAVSGRMVYAGGEFTHIGGQQRYHVAALDAVSGAATVWNPNVNGFVNALAVSGNTVYAGGDFTTIGGQARNHIAALNAKTGVALAWNPHADDFVHTLAVSGNAVYAGGDFTTIGGQARNRIAALDAATGAALAWNPGADNTVSVLVVPGGTVYAGGAFSTIGGQARNRIAAVDAVTGTVTSWNPNADGAVSALAVSGGTVYAGGAFVTIGGQARNCIAVLDAATGAATSWDLNAGGTVHALAVSGTKVCAGGAFTSIGGRVRNRIAALDAATGAATSWNPNADGRVSVLTVSGTTLYAGGAFTSIGGQTRNRVATLDAVTGAATSWNPNANGSVSTLAVSGTTLYAGGAFTGIGGQTRNRIAALSTTTGSATSWNPNANGSVSALAVSGATVYAGGTFTSIGGQTRNRIAALDAATGSVASWNPNANGTVHCLAVSGSTVYVGGRFTGIGGQTRNSIAALNAATGSATSWNPSATYLPGLVTADVYALAVSGTTVYAGGSFLMFGGRTRMNAASVTVSGSTLATAWNPIANHEIYALAVSGTTLYAGGDFSIVDWVSQPGFAQFDPPGGAAPPSKPLAEETGTDRIVWTWQDNSDEEAGYKVYGDPGMELPGTLQTTTAADTTSCEQTGLSPNTLYTFQVAATNAVGDSEKTELYAAWTLAEVAAAPVVTNPTPYTLDVTLGADSNPEGTLYAIQVSPEAGGGSWVQEDGSVGTTPVYQPAAVWGTATVTGLAPQTPYAFTVTARNWDGVDAAAGPAASGTTRNAPLPPGPVVINGGAGSTNTTAVTLTLTWSPWAGFEVRRMRFSNDGATWSPWEPLAATRAWTLREGDGYKTVRVQFLDRAGNYSDRFSDYIRLDTTPPTGTIVINGNQPATLSPEVTLSLTWDDAGGSGVTRMRFSDNGSTWSPWGPLSATRAHTLPSTPGYHTVRVTYRDAAGNVSERFADYIRLDLP